MDKSDIRAQLDSLLTRRSGDEMIGTLNTVLWATASERAQPQPVGHILEPNSNSGKVSTEYANLIEGLTGEVSSLSKILGEVKTASLEQMATTERNTLALAESTASKLREAAGALSGVIGAGSGWFNLIGGIGTAISGISKLFGGGSKDAQPELPLYYRPPSIAAEAGLPINNTSGLVEISYGQDGQARTAPRQSATVPQVTVQVQAIDSRSFLDHSDEIARAVREAVLNMHSLNDVMSEL